MRGLLVSPSRVLLLDASGPEAEALTRAANAAGHEVHVATEPATHGLYGSDFRRMFTGHVLTDFARPEQALNEIVGYGRSIDVDAVLTTNEYLTPMLAEACALLRLPGNAPANADAARNKIAMTKAFLTHGVDAPRTRTVVDEADLDHLLATGNVSLPCVVKPADAAGSAGVTVLRERSAISAAWQATRTAKRMHGIQLDHRVLVQDYIEGPEYSVESITQEGRTTHLCITAKILGAAPHAVEIGHSLPVHLPPPIERRAYVQAERAIKAVGIRNGASHTELKIAPDGHCTVIEVGARAGAGHIGFLIRLALGIDLWAAVLDIALGHPATPTPVIRNYATIRFLTSPIAGQLNAVTGMPAVTADVPAAHVRATIGRHVAATRSNQDRLGYFIVTGSDAVSVERQADELLAQISIDVVSPPPTQAAPCPSPTGSRKART